MLSLNHVFSIQPHMYAHGWNFLQDAFKVKSWGFYRKVGNLLTKVSLSGEMWK
jgi:hypothetical protein